MEGCIIESAIFSCIFDVLGALHTRNEYDEAFAYNLIKKCRFECALVHCKQTLSSSLYDRC